MFAHCCGHATIVAPAATIIWAYRVRRPTASTDLRFQSAFDAPGARNNLSGDGSGNFASPHRVTNWICRSRIAAESQNAIRIDIIPAADDRSIALRAMRRRRKLRRLTINRVRKGSRHFCAAGTFCACFRHATMHRLRAPAQRTFIHIARQNNVVRDFSQTFLIAVGIEARACGSTARTPFASQYCPCRAQIRRAHVQPRTRLAVLLRCG